MCIYEYICIFRFLRSTSAIIFLDHEVNCTIQGKSSVSTSARAIRCYKNYVIKFVICNFSLKSQFSISNQSQFQIEFNFIFKIKFN